MNFLPSILAFSWYGLTLNLVMFVFVLICIFLMLLVLIQKGRGGGLAGAFGGGGGSTAFGAKTGDVLTWATSIVFGIFLLVAIALNLMTQNNRIAKAAPTTLPTRSHLPAQVPLRAPATRPAAATPMEASPEPASPTPLLPATPAAAPATAPTAPPNP